MIEVEIHYYAIPDVMIDLSNNHQWVLKSLGERLIKSFAIKCQVDTIGVHGSTSPPLNLGHPDIMCLLMW